MYTEISFPALGLTVDPPRYLQIGPLTIYYYGVIIAVGLILAVLYGCKRSREFGIREDDLVDGVLWVTPFAILCARAYYCLFSWDYYRYNPVEILYIWEGGLAIYGGVLGALLGVFILCMVKKIKFPALLDVVLLGFLIGQSIGRWGNFMNREAFGAETDYFLRMGLLNSVTGNVKYVHPTFLYESAWNALGFVLLHFLSKKRRYDGQIALGYVAWYGLGRALIEGLRMDSLYIGTFRVSQLLAAASCLIALGVLIFMSTRKHDPAALFVNVRAARELEAAEEEAAEEKAAEEESEPGEEA